MWIWRVKGNGRNILVDTGSYHNRFFHDGHVNDFIRPSEAIGKLDLKPDDITDVVISHMHWEHADGMDLFPKACVWI